MSQGHRQQPGLACEECRRRKARCDRVRPSCRSCQDAGTRCHYVDKRPQRGPRKGEMSALKNLVANLEQRLGEQRGKQQPDSDPALSEASQRPDAVPEAFVQLEHNSTLVEKDTMSFSFDLENENLDVTAFENTGLESTIGSTSLSSTCLETTPFRNDSLVNADMDSIWANKNESNAMSDQDYMNDWLDIDAIMSPSATTSGTQQFFARKHMQLLGPNLSDLIQADLVQPVSPMIHRGNYFAWASQECPSPAQTALRYAMRAVAAAVSAQYRPLSGMLCAESRRLLEQIDANGTGDCSDTPIEQIQAWLLVAHWELLCKHEHQAMLTTGRVIRMVQLARLHEVDAYSVPFMSLGAETPLFPPSSLSEEERFAVAEEKRRVFWLAYCFDRFCLMVSEYPPSLQEESIRTRLPAPEANFQKKQPIRMEFLPEALAHNGLILLPPFAKCVVLNSLFSRCTSQQRFSPSSPISGRDDSRELRSQYAWFALAVEKRKQLLVEKLPGATNYVDDPMLTFVHALASCVAIYVYQSLARSMTWTTVDHDVASPTYEEQAIQAASELIHFVKMTPQSISSFKAHPFLPALIHRAAVFLRGLPRSPSNAPTGCNTRDEDLSALLGALRNLQQVNNLSGGILSKLEKEQEQQ